jgi:hypothetical protein
LESYGRYAEQTTYRLSAPLSKYLTKTATRSLQEKLGSIQLVMLPTWIHAVGLCVPPAEYRLYTGIFRPKIQSSRYHSSCISAMSISLLLTVLVIIPEASMPCYKLA